MHRPEFALIDWIRSQVTDRAPVRLGIGDDAAVLRPSPDRETLVAIDMLMEGVHFNLSDIAAMGGRATAAFVSVALPHDRGMDFARDVHAGLIELANEHNVVLAGGDTNSWRGPLVISVTVIGEPLGHGPVCRSGARAGDWLFVTGALGGSLPSGRHLSFPPRLAEARRLVGMVDLHAMLDISDGLAADLHHLLRASGVGAILDAAEIPLTEAARNAGDERSPLMHGLSDGEDFELVFAVSPADGGLLCSSWNGATPITRIGEVTDTGGCQLRFPNGRMEALPPLGWVHRLGADN
jgi:thiamine-monophosphate kinase